ncbi:DUF4214 domain-containing protein [Inhella proteolytica]|uniref:DUF4214 domain-containing protein n=1 Tax=Inhella proteolytica TaxID=2795029 RepID=A0A931J3N6_9BURK|nr:DUF4214 domain-containing protein [Inhella proteolytica]MBH9576959.1 DUF4214 domain-containing protein [Inhella proteolytica]
MSTVQGQMDGDGDADAFSVFLQAGQRYRFTVKTPSGASSFGSELKLQSGEGKVLFSTASSVSQGAELVGSPETTGWYQLVLTGHSGLNHSVQYEIEAAPLPVDDHSDRVTRTEKLLVGQTLPGQLETRGDVDSFSLDLNSGQRYQFQLDLTGASNAASGIVVKLYRGFDERDATLINEWQSNSDGLIDFDFSTPSGSSYFVTVGATPSGKAATQEYSATNYRLGLTQYSFAAEDDYPNFPLAPSDLRLVQSLQAQFPIAPLDLSNPQDVDWVPVYLVAGTPINITVLKKGLPSESKVSIHDAQGIEFVRGVGEVLFIPPTTGSYWLRAAPEANSSALPSDYEARLRSPYPESDQNNGPQNALFMPVGRLEQSTLYGAGDTDWYRFSVSTIYERSLFRVEVGSGSRPLLQLLKDRGTFEGFSEGSIDSWFQQDPDNPKAYIFSFTPSTSGLQHLIIGANDHPVDRSSRGYTIQRIRIEQDDHGETSNSSTPVNLNQVLQHELTLGDIDLFRLNLEAGKRYQIEHKGGRDGVADSLHLLDDKLHPTGFEMPPTGVLEVEPGRSGSYYLKSMGLGTYTLSVTEIRPDDHPGGGSQLASLGPLPGLNFQGLLVRGGPGADILRGGAEADWLFGGDGADRIEGGPGADVIDGGNGIDRALYSYSLAQHRVQISAQQVVVEGSGAESQGDLLQQVERLVFSQGPALALDLEGHAGQVARLIGALFGKATLTDASLVGLGLRYLDGGMAFGELVAAAVASDLFAERAGSHGHADFVRTVYQNVVGQAPSEATLAEFVGQLDRGETSQAVLARMACELPMTAQQIDLVGLAGSGLPYLEG